MQAGTSARPKNGMRPVHPGEVLREDFLVPLNMTPNSLASALRAALSKIEGVVNEQREIDADLALRLARYFSCEPELFLNLQQAYDLKIAQRANGARIEAEVAPREVTDAL
ncbi:HigA family addiction module antitoxin [Paraburkholderia nemoris]|uniref:HigA family addiction module antitoxin n=1 Tax=Paraburkholderia nemoris TaxID=2793076 RepID=UPI001F334E99|nr:HigA family addiction module antitoxin [Paraburkholderia nemoris]